MECLPPSLQTSCYPMKRATSPELLLVPCYPPIHRTTEVRRIWRKTNHQNFRFQAFSDRFLGAGVATMLGKRSMSFSGVEACEEMTAEDELSDDCSQLGEKKKRLNLEQVRTLERNFEMGNKLEPERKMQLARALGLQPRQVAIWFQNRRARWKTKQLEKDYDALKGQFEAVKAENDALKAQNKKLHAEVLSGNCRIEFIIS